MSDIYSGPRPLESDGSPGDETVAHLLRLAGNRPMIPAADAAIVKAAARAEWQSLVWTTRRRKLYLVRGAGGFLAAAAALLLALNTNIIDTVRRTVTPAVAQVVTTSGAVDLEVGHELWSGDTVATGAATGDASPRAALQLAEGASIRVDAGTRLSLRSASVLELESGTIYVDSHDTSLEIHTPLGTVTNIGTRFEVHLAPSDNTLRVRVREGKVQLKDLAGEQHFATVGQQLITERATTQATEFDACGRAWEWVLDVRAPFAGTSTLDIIEWTAAEAGWDLRFKDEAAEGARTAVISEEGYEPSLQLEDNLRYWVPSAGLKYRIEDCTLIVEPARR